MTADLEVADVAVGGDAAAGDIEFTILMPCLNEAETVGSCVRKAIGYLAGAGLSGEVLVADNGSTDGSAELARQAGARVVEVPRRGYGAALIAGIRAARGGYVIMGDADDSYDFSALDPFVTALRGGADLVMGNRFKGGIQPGAMPKLHRYLGNPVLSFLGRRLFGTHVGDLHCGLRAFRRDRAVSLDLRTTGMEFASEMVVKATLSSFRMVEVPTRLYPDGRSRPPHLRRWRDGWRHLRFLLLYSPRWLFFYPGLLVAVVGAVGLGLLASATWTPGRGRFSEGLLIASGGLVIAGVQALASALLAREFAATQGLLPPPGRRARRVTERLTLEVGLATAALFVTTSLGLLVYSLAISPQSNPHAPEATLAFRLGALAITIGIVGAQAALGSWLFSLLSLPRIGSVDRSSPDRGGRGIRTHEDASAP